MNKKYRKTIIAGNWKMNKTASETRAYAEEIREMLPKQRPCDVVLCIPAINIPPALAAFKGTKISIGAQTLHFENSGAFTGETAADMLKDLGVKYVITGHSERRLYYKETDITVNMKIRSAIENGISPIVCVGENLQQRALGVYTQLLDYQLAVALSGVSAREMRSVIIAYEPIWAIGTGKTAKNEQAQEICAHIRAFLRKKYDARTARAISILYGGSMNAKNAAGLLSMPDIDGGLIGGASLKCADFAAIIKAAEEQK